MLDVIYNMSKMTYNGTEQICRTSEWTGLGHAAAGIEPRCPVLRRPGRLAGAEAPQKIRGYRGRVGGCVGDLCEE